MEPEGGEDVGVREPEPGVEPGGVPRFTVTVRGCEHLGGCGILDGGGSLDLGKGFGCWMILFSCERVDSWKC